MGTSLSGLTPATTFDGLLKTSDNEPLDGTLKAISTGDGTDTILQLSDSMFNIGGTDGLFFNATTNQLRIGAEPDFYQIKVESAQIGGLQVGEDAFNNMIRSASNIRMVPLSGGVAISNNYTTAAANTMFHIKGSGASSGTASLLVQNSAGTDLLKVADNGNVLAKEYIYPADGTTNSSFRLSNGNGTQMAYAQGIIIVNPNFRYFTSYLNKIALEVTATTGDVSINGATGAKMAIKGSGNDNTTTALLVQNSDGVDILKVLDSKEIQLNTGITGSITTIDATTTNLKQGDLYFRASTGGYLGRFNPDGFQIGNGATGAAARLQVKGSGASSGTTALLVQNSTGAEHLKITDDGVVDVRQSLNVNHPTVSSRALKMGWGSIFATDNGSELSIGAVYSQTTAPRIILGGKTRTAGADAIQVQALNGMYLSTTANAENPSAQLHIKGSGDDNTTNALLIQNSASTPLDLFKVLDDGTLLAPNLPTSATGLPTGAIWNDGGTLKIA